MLKQQSNNENNCKSFFLAHFVYEYEKERSIRRIDVCPVLFTPKRATFKKVNQKLIDVWPTWLNLVPKVELAELLCFVMFSFKKYTVFTSLFSKMPQTTYKNDKTMHINNVISIGVVRRNVLFFYLRVSFISRSALELCRKTEDILCNDPCFGSIIAVQEDLWKADVINCRALAQNHSGWLRVLQQAQN